MRLRVLTLNAWALPSPLSHAPDQRMQAIGARLPELDVDVAAFQEIWSRSARERLIEAGRRAGYTHVWSRRGSLGSSGMLVLSRVPIRSARFRRFALCGLPQHLTRGDYYGGKGIASLELSTPDGDVGLLATHLIPHYGDYGPDDVYLGHRIAEVVELAHELARTELPALVVGDFNFTEREPEYEVLMSLCGLRDVAAVLDQREDTILPGPPYRANERPPGVRIDYVFARAGVGRVVIPTRIERVLDEPIEIDGELAGYSDHAGLVAEVAFETSRPKRVRPEARAVERAAEFLREGRRRAERRRSDHLSFAAGGGAFALAAVGSTVIPHISRRRMLRAALIALPSLALASSAGIGVLADRTVSAELAGYDRVERLLASLAHASGAASAAAARETVARAVAGDTANAAGSVA